MAATAVAVAAAASAVAAAVVSPSLPSIYLPTAIRPAVRPRRGTARTAPEKLRRDATRHDPP